MGTPRAEASAVQSFVFCIRADGSAFVGDLGELCADWLCAMHRAEEPTPGIWERVPSELLPDGAAIAYFNAGAFFEDVVRPSFSERPARMSNAEGAVMAMVQEFIDTGAHYDETLRAQFPLFRGDPPPGHPYPEAWANGSPQSTGPAGNARNDNETFFSGRGRRLGD